MFRKEQERKIGGEENEKIKLTFLLKSLSMFVGYLMRTFRILSRRQLALLFNMVYFRVLWNLSLAIVVLNGDRHL